MKKLVTAALFLTAGFSMSAHAGLISGPITFDGGKSVDLQGLEWMPLSYTVGKSRVEVEGGFSDVSKPWGTGGWRYATRKETERLLGSLWGGNYDGWSHDNFAGASTFLQSFGATKILSASDAYSNFIFGEAGDCLEQQNTSCFAHVRTILSFPNNHWEYNVPSKGYAISTFFGQSAGWFGSNYGVYMGYARSTTTHIPTLSYDTADPAISSLLVRSVDTPVATVSSPAAISLFALGLCGLLLRRRQIAE